jgi:hypothetical protein
VGVAQADRPRQGLAGVIGTVALLAGVVALLPAA